MKNLIEKLTTRMSPLVRGFGTKTVLIVFIFALISCGKNTDPKLDEDPKKEPGTPSGNGGGNESSEFSVGISKNFSAAASLNYSNVNAVADFYAGEHPVAIYATPEGKGSNIGKGKLVISRSGTTFTMKLLNASGTVLAENNVDINANGGDTYKQFIRTSGTPSNTTITTWANTTDYKRQQILIYADDSGELYDGFTSVQFSNQYRFRNNVEHFGTKPPAAFAALKGTWEGQHLQPLCSPNPVTVTIADDGSVNFKGKASITCAVQDATVKWDGQDDFVRPNTKEFNQIEAGSQIAIDYSRTIRDSQNNNNRGGALIVVPKLKDPTSVIDAQYYANPSYAGPVIVRKPTKK